MSEYQRRKGESFGEYIARVQRLAAGEPDDPPTLESDAADLIGGLVAGAEIGRTIVGALTGQDPRAVPEQPSGLVDLLRRAEAHRVQGARLEELRRNAEHRPRADAWRDTPPEVQGDVDDDP